MHRPPQTPRDEPQIDRERHLKGELREVRRRFATLLDNLPGMAYRCANDADWTMELVSDGCQALTGYRPEQLIANHDIAYNDLIAPVDREEVARRVSAAVEEGRSFKLTYRIHTASGALRWVFEQGKAVFDQGGQLQAIEGFITDITELRQTEDRLREQQTSLDIAQRLSSSGSFIWNLRDDSLTVSENMHHITGLPPEDFDGTFTGSAVRLVLPEDLVELRRQLEAMLAAGETWPTEFRLRRPDGEERLFRSESVLSFDDQGRPSKFVGVHKDITEERRAEREREGLERQLLEAQKLEALGTLAGGIAHNFNNILAAILGNAELAQLDLEKGHPARESLDHLITAGFRGKDMVQQLLGFSRRGVAGLRPLSLTPIILESLALLRSSLPSTIAIEQGLDASHDRVLADSAQIQQLLLNLCNNAAQSMAAEGGTLRVELSELDLTAGQVVEIRVIDTGEGMDPATASRAFEPFFTTRHEEGLSGLGLSVVHGIVRSHSGTIDIDSAPGRGSTISVRLPIAKGEEVSIEESALHIDHLPRGSERVLFVDDERSLTAIAQRALDRLGYRVTTFTSSASALAAFRRAPESFDLVITDYTMPEMTGVTLAQRMLELRPDLPIILATGYSQHISEEQALELGIRRFVTKPLSLYRLALVVRETLDGDG